MRKHKIQDKVLTTLGGIVPLHLGIRSGHCGLLGDFFIALNGLLFAERIGATAFPNWGSRSLYFDERYGPNAWEYFFQFKGSRNKRALPVQYFSNALGFESKGQRTARQVASDAVTRLGKPSTAIAAAVTAFCEERFEGKYTVGLHVRGTDAARGLESRTTVPLRHYIDELERLDRQRTVERIYLATDELKTVDYFQKHYSSLLILQDNCIRSSDGASVHGHYDSGVVGSGYEKGYQVMMDALLLAKCDYLVRCHSRVTCYSLCISPTLPFTDLDLTVNKRNRTPWLHE